MLLCIAIIRRIKRHTNSVEECLQVSLLLGIAAYWLPSVLFLILPIWGYLIYQNLFSLRSFLSTLIGFAIVAIWLILLSQVWPQTFHLSPFTSNLYFWIPTGAAIFAWLASTIARQILRVR